MKTKNPLLISQGLHVCLPVLGAKDQCSMEKNRTGGENSAAQRTSLDQIWN
jgi:hypothetical protein